MEATKVNAIMQQLDESDRNRHNIKTNINHFSSLFESDDEEGNNNMTKPKTQIIVLREQEEGRENKGYKNKGNEEYEDDQEKKTTVKMYNPDSKDELNGDFRMVEHDDNIDNDNKDHIPREK